MSISAIVAISMMAGGFLVLGAIALWCFVDTRHAEWGECPLCLGSGEYEAKP